jgi:hypothetical protein
MNNKLRIWLNLGLSQVLVFLIPIRYIYPTGTRAYLATKTINDKHQTINTNP